jgi:tetratricopeptide (TPR) repeat protein
MRKLKHPLGALPSLPSFTGQESVAVLPFSVTGTDTANSNDEYLAYGLADGLATRLSNEERLIVRPTSSVQRYRGETVDPIVAGRDLGVSFVITGNVERQEDSLQISAALINVPEEAERWSIRFNEKSTDALQNEDSISARLAGELIVELIQERGDAFAAGSLTTAQAPEDQAEKVAGGPDSLVASPPSQSPETLNEEAQQLYTAGRYYATRRTAEGLWQAIDRLKRAVELDPKFALAYSELADCYALLNWYLEPPPENAWNLAKQSAISAVNANPKLAEARASLGFVRLHYDRDWEAAERELRTAIQLKPSAQVAHRWYAYSLSAMGRHNEAFAEMERAREISPQSAVLATAVANVLFLAGRYDEAIQQCQKAMELDSGSVAAHTVLRWAYEKKGMHREALAAFEQERVFAGDTATTHLKRAAVLAAVGRREEAEAVLKEVLDKRSEQWVSPYEIAIVYCWLGDVDNSFQWLAQAEREHSVGFTFVRVDPRLEGLRADPRFDGLLRGLDRTIP